MKKSKTNEAADKILEVLKKNGGIAEPRRIIKNKYYRWAFWELMARGQIGLNQNRRIVLAKPDNT